jgi:hypothetical protein
MNMDYPELLKSLLTTLQANVDHHIAHDNYSGYPDSELCDTNANAIRAIRGALADADRAQRAAPVSDAKPVVWQINYMRDGSPRTAWHPQNNVAHYTAIDPLATSTPLYQK